MAIKLNSPFPKTVFAHQPSEGGGGGEGKGKGEKKKVFTTGATCSLPHALSRINISEIKRRRRNKKKKSQMKIHLTL